MSAQLAVQESALKVQQARSAGVQMATSAVFVSWSLASNICKVPRSHLVSTSVYGQSVYRSLQAHYRNHYLDHHNMQRGAGHKQRLPLHCCVHMHVQSGLCSMLPAQYACIIQITAKTQYHMVLCISKNGLNHKAYSVCLCDRGGLSLSPALLHDLPICTRDCGVYGPRASA